jgi:hypothetical protein
MRRLVIETGDGVTRVDFPAGEGTAVGGWDGVAVCAAATAFIPAGLSLWELSAGKRTTAKANEDYNKRADTPDGSPTADATYCAVSVRRWSDRRKWAKDRAADGRWNAVRSHGVDDLEAWLESAPVTHAWLSELLGLRPYGIRTPNAWWQAWSAATEPNLTPDLVLAGREGAANTLLDTLAGPPAMTTLRCDSPDEALAVLTSVLLRDDGDGGSLLARTLFVDDVVAWRRLTEQPRPLLLVACTPEVVEEARVTGAKHHVVVPVNGIANADVDVPALEAALVSEVLRTGGMDDRRAGEAGALARRSLLALRRHLAVKPELHTPPWAEAPVPRLIRAALLAGKWHNNAEGDQDVLAAMAGVEREALRDRITELAAGDDPYVLRSAGTWLVVSPYDAWLQLRRSVTPEDLQRFSTAVITALTEKDPAFGMDQVEVLRASREGKVRRHSHDLRDGLGTTLALLGTMGSDIDAGQGMTGASLAKYLVDRLLLAANEDPTGATWSALATHLTRLAEASPDALLDGVRAGLTGDRPLLTLFQEREGLLFPSSDHPSLLWALEVTAWSPDHLGPAVDLISRLAELDPGGRLGNRPDEVLRSVFCPWHPETAAGVERRLAVLDALRTRHPEIAWSLMVALLPDSDEIHSPTAAPQFRDWKPASHGVTSLQWHEFVSGLVPRVIEGAANSTSRWRQLIAETTTLFSADRAAVRDSLANRLRDDQLEVEGRDKLWEELRALIARHRTYAYTEWALPEDDLQALDAIANQLAPNDPIEESLWLFEDDFPDLGDDSKGHEDQYDHDVYTEALWQRRRIAAQTILDAEGWDGILRAVEQVDPEKVGGTSWALGRATAQIDGGAHDHHAIALLSGPREALATGYLVARFQTAGWSWLEDNIENQVPEVQAKLLLISQDYPRSWEHALALGVDTDDAYWRAFHPYGLGHGFPYAEHCARRMLRVARPASALQILNLYVFRDTTANANAADIAATALQEMLDDTPESGGIPPVRQHELQQAFAFLERHASDLDATHIARLQWSYLPALGHKPSVPSLHAALAAEPELFVELVSTIYRPRAGGDETPISADRQGRAQNAYNLLTSWKRPPGLSSDGTIDEVALRDWVDTVRSLLSEADRLEVGEEHIGMVLAGAPADTDGLWPDRSLRDLLEDLQSERLEHAITRALYNGRGTTSRSPTDGGDQERVLANKHREEAQRLADRWPRTATVIRRLAESLESDARRFDEEAERRRRGLD